MKLPQWISTRLVEKAVSLQWIHTRLVEKASVVSLEGANPFTWCTELYPYVVPKGHWLGIVDVQFGSKFTDGGSNQRASYLIIDNVLSLPDNIGFASFRVPLVIPEGIALTARYINNDSELQWMQSAVTALLVPKREGQTYQEAFAFLIR